MSAYTRLKAHCSLTAWTMLLLFASLPTHAAAPAGAWWDTDFAYRQQFSVDAGSDELSAGYSASIIFNHAIEVAAGRSLENGNDIRVVRWTGSAWEELHRVVDVQSAWNATNTQIWFAMPEAIDAGIADDDYYLYYGNPDAALPPQDHEEVFLLFDGFEGSSLDTSRWSRSGSPTVSGGVLELPAGASIRSQQAFDAGTIWEARIRVPETLPNGGSQAYYLWLATQGSDVDSPTIGFYAQANRYYALSYIHFFLLFPQTDQIDADDPSSWQTYGFVREEGGAVRYRIDSSQVSEQTPWPLYATMHALARNGADGNKRVQEYDWLRIRRYRTNEPDVELLGAAEQFAPVAEWRMEETGWNGASGEVLDSASQGLHLASMQSGGSGANTALATPARPGNPGSCRYGAFDGANDYLQRGDHAALDMTSRLSIAAWVRPASIASSSGLKTILSKDNNYEFHINSAGQVNWWWGGGARELTTSTTIALDEWSHIAITYESGAQRIYVNGTLRASKSVSGALATNNLPLQIGQDQGIAGRFWHGYIDEVQIYSRVLSQAEVVTAMNAAHPCAAAAPPHFVVEHDKHGIHCAPEEIAVHARDAANNPNSQYGSSVRLDTGSGTGNWSLLSGGGSLANGSSDDGVATYHWPIGESTASFSLSYRDGAAAIDIDTYQASDPSIRDDDSEGLLMFSQSGFTVTSSALSNPPPATIPAFHSPQIAGTEFALHITAYGQTPNDTRCGVIESYSGAKPIEFWSRFSNPASGTIPVTIDGYGLGASESSATTVNVVFDAGQAAVTAKYKDVGEIAIELKDTSSPDPNLPTGARGSTGDLISRPDSFEISAIRRTDNALSNPSAASASGPVFLPAGSAFSATVTARDAEGDPTPNFGREWPAESVMLELNLVAPAGGASPPIGASVGFAAFSNGSSTATDLSWPEVGIIALRARVADGSYLGAGDVLGEWSENVGRFVPFDLALDVPMLPMFRTACAAGGFTYIGEAFDFLIEPVVHVRAMNEAGDVTTNYRDAFFKLTNASLGTRSYAEAMHTLDQSGLPTPNVDPVIEPGIGTGTLTYSAGAGLAIERSTPIAPLDAQVTLTIEVRDDDNVASSQNPYVVGSSAIGFSAGSTMRYGRIAFRNAIGSELVDLPIALRSEYFAGAAAGFVPHPADTCTSGVALSLDVFGGALQAGETCVLDSAAPGLSGQGCSSAATAASRFRSPPDAGDFNLTLRAPGAGNSGTVTITADVPSWLEFDWDAGAAGAEDPSGIATFGVFQGSSKRIYQRERF